MFSESSSHRQSVTNTGHSLISEVPVNTLILAFMGAGNILYMIKFMKGIMFWGGEKGS